VHLCNLSRKLNANLAVFYLTARKASRWSTGQLLLWHSPELVQTNDNVDTQFSQRHEADDVSPVCRRVFDNSREFVRSDPVRQLWRIFRYFPVAAKCNTTQQWQEAQLSQINRASLRTVWKCHIKSHKRLPNSHFTNVTIVIIMMTWFWTSHISYFDLIILVIVIIIVIITIIRPVKHKISLP